MGSFVIISIAQAAVFPKKQAGCVYVCSWAAIGSLDAGCCIMSVKQLKMPNHPIYGNPCPSCAFPPCSNIISMDRPK